MGLGQSEGVISSFFFTRPDGNAATHPHHQLFLGVGDEITCGRLSVRGVCTFGAFSRSGLLFVPSSHSNIPPVIHYTNVGRFDSVSSFPFGTPFFTFFSSGATYGYSTIPNKSRQTEPSPFLPFQSSAKSKSPSRLLRR